jgi:hypothetical protein
MYDLLDCPVHQLPTFERGILDRTRRWTHAIALAGRAPADPEGESAFDRAMAALDAGSTDALVIERPCHSTVGDTEAVILGLWRLVKAGRPTAALDAGALLLDKPHARTLVDAMGQVVAQA